MPGPLTPRIFRLSVLGAPCLVHGGQLFVDGDVLILAQALQQAYGVGRIHIAAGSVAHAEIIRLHAAENRHDLLSGKRQHAVVLQKHNALRACPAAQLRKSRLNLFLADRLCAQLLGKKLLVHVIHDDPPFCMENKAFCAFVC